MEVIKPSLVENTNATTMESIVDQVPGVNVIDGQANIRGGAGWSYGAGSRVLVLVDDIPQLSADASDAKWTFIPTENLEQVEVIKGATSALFGSSALNGVINFRTAYPRDTRKPMSASIQASTTNPF
jgi:iron complex outermembrane receptor protein